MTRTELRRPCGVGTKRTLCGLVLVPSGTIHVRVRVHVVGAGVGEHAWTGPRSEVAFEDDVVPSGRVPTGCNGGNPRTTDTCGRGTCTHSVMSFGHPCVDGDVCNENETCDGIGHR